MPRKNLKKSKAPVHFPQQKAVAALGNPLIEASFDMEPNELKLLMFVCSLIHDEDDFYTYSFTAEQVANALGRKFDRKNQGIYGDLMDWSKTMMKRLIVLPDYVPEGGGVPRLRVTTLFDFWDYIGGDGRVEVGLKPWLKPYLLGLKSEFTRIALKDFMRLGTFYGLKLFMLLQQYRKFGRRKFSLEELRFALGVEESKYPRWSDFYERVVKGAIKDLDRADLLVVETTLHKRGAKVAGVEFKFYKPGQEERNVTPSPEEQAALSLRMEHFAEWQAIRKELQGELGFDPDAEQDELDKEADIKLANQLNAKKPKATSKGKL